MAVSIVEEENGKVQISGVIKVFINPSLHVRVLYSGGENVFG